MRKSICINAENAENAMKINAQTDLQFGKLLWSIRHHVNVDIFSIVNLISIVVACLNKFQHWMVWYIYVTNGQENVNVESSMLFLSYLYYDHLLKPSPVLPWFLMLLQSLSLLNHWCHCTMEITLFIDSSFFFNVIYFICNFSNMFWPLVALNIIYIIPGANQIAAKEIFFWCLNQRNITTWIYFMLYICNL